MSYSIEDVNKMSKQMFVEKIGSVFELSPWIAEQAWEEHPYDHVNSLYEVMVNKMYEANMELQLGLLKAHPDLGTKLEMTDSSIGEQSEAGLSELTDEEYKEFSKLNRLYMDRFAFPFIMAVKGCNKDLIKECMYKRIENDFDKEFQTALREVCKIARFRLIQLFNQPN
ncbi:2-oxo-4-hydroxy-4-carboxy-5-ureidoimidazoline decarboxylase [Halalkalibacter krulwichiae]|uniref:2-oxo-4-hydroxy-4-carboxy-5-ureidoimidazoline decarboxylase n=1 Tax=Halalkalibacter krulwichiae TaxID=199441 RepID=A0A1X9M658_9BACI|nr:2-oxo-4-hydroxy-4-carboxy-5-ureidoimidazoline decarboxylase [Halalkalibacter krulwichiae]ARK28938.1 Uric acid degradation bifunctional protein PucL [Halalkalibacter krulwichiae]